MDNLHDRALEVARQTLAADAEFPELIELARLLLEATLNNHSLANCGESTSREATELSREPSIGP